MPRFELFFSDLQLIVFIPSRTDHVLFVHEQEHVPFQPCMPCSSPLPPILHFKRSPEETAKSHGVGQTGTGTLWHHHLALSSSQWTTPTVTSNPDTYRGSKPWNVCTSRLTIKLDRLKVLSESSLLVWFLQVSLTVIIKGRSPMEVSLIVTSLPTFPILPIIHRTKQMTGWKSNIIFEVPTRLHRDVRSALQPGGGGEG